jgi:hypothetical protein
MSGATEDRCYKPTFSKNGRVQQLRMLTGNQRQFPDEQSTKCANDTDSRLKSFNTLCGCISDFTQAIVTLKICWHNVGLLSRMSQSGCGATSSVRKTRCTDAGAKTIPAIYGMIF